MIQCFKTQVLSIEAYHISDHKEEHEEEYHQFLSLHLNLDSVNHPVELFENFKSWVVFWVITFIRILKFQKSEVQMF